MHSFAFKYTLVGAVLCLGLLLVLVPSTTARTLYHQDAGIYVERETPTSPGSIPDPITWFKGLTAKQQRIVTIVFCVTMMLVGIVFVFFGYRMFKPCLGLIGFLFFFTLLWIILNAHTDLKWWAVLLISLAVGLVGAFLAGFIFQIGLFFLGLFLGFTIGSMLLSTPFGTKVVPQYWAHFGILLGFAVIFAVLAVIFQKALTIVGTSLIGSFLFCNAIDIAWLKTGILSDIIVQFLSHHPLNLPPIGNEKAYGLLGGAVALALLGTIIQALVTARHYNHHGIRIKTPDYERENLLVNSHYHH